MGNACSDQSDVEKGAKEEVEVTPQRQKPGYITVDEAKAKDAPDGLCYTSWLLCDPEKAEEADFHMVVFDDEEDSMLEGGKHILPKYANTEDSTTSGTVHDGASASKFPERASPTKKEVEGLLRRVHSSSATEQKLSRSDLWKRLDQLVDVCGGCSDIEFGNGQNLFHVAACLGWTGLVKRLLEGGKLTLSKAILGKDKDGFTPLHYIAWYGRFEILQLLLRQWKDLKLADCVSDKTKGKRNVYHLAARNGHSRTLKLLISFASETPGCKLIDLLSTKDCLGMTPLHLGALHGRQQVTHLLLKNGAFADEQDKYERTALHIAAIRGHTSVGKSIIENRGKFIVNMRAKDGFTALIYASVRDKEEFVTMLLEHNADLCPQPKTSTLPNVPSVLSIAVRLRCGLAVRAFITSDRWEEAFAVTGLDDHKRNTKKGGTQIVENITTVLAEEPDLFELLLDQFSFDDESYSADALLQENMRPTKPLYRHYCFRYLYHHFSHSALTFSNVTETQNPTRGSSPTQNPMQRSSPTQNPTERNSLMLNPVQESSQTQNRTQGDSPSQSATRGSSPTQDHHGCITRRSKRLRHVCSVHMECQSKMINHEDSPNKQDSRCIVQTILDHQNLRHLLLKPIIVQWMRKKWIHFVWKLCLFNLFLYSLFLIFLTILIASIEPYQRCPYFLDMNDLGKYKRGTLANVSAVFVIIMALIGLFKECFEWKNRGWPYLGDISNYIEWPLYVTAISFAVAGDRPSEKDWIVGMIAITFAWTNLMLFLIRFTFFGIYIVMFFKILQTVIQVFIVYALFIIGFGLAFYVLLSEIENFDTVGRALASTLTFATDGLDLTDFFSISARQVIDPSSNSSCMELDKVKLQSVQAAKAPVVHLLYPFWSWVYLIAFVFIGPIILTNMLTGLAVDDIAEIRKKSAEDIAERQAQLILESERIICVFRRLSFCHRLLPSFYEKDCVRQPIYGRGVGHSDKKFGFKDTPLIGAIREVFAFNLDDDQPISVQQSFYDSRLDNAEVTNKQMAKTMLRMNARIDKLTAAQDQLSSLVSDLGIMHMDTTPFESSGEVINHLSDEKADGHTTDLERLHYRLEQQKTNIERIIDWQQQQGTMLREILSQLKARSPSSGPATDRTVSQDGADIQLPPVDVSSSEFQTRV